MSDLKDAGPDCEFEQLDDQEWYCKTHGCTLIGWKTEPVQCASGRIISEQKQHDKA